MGRIAVLLRDCPADKGRGRRPGIRHIMTPEQWSEILEADARGVSSKTMFAALSGVVTPFFSNPKQFANAITGERKARRKVVKK